MDNITPEQWVDWKNRPETREFIKQLNDSREDLKEGLAEGHADQPKDYDQTIGRCMALRDVIVHVKQLGKGIDEDAI